MPQLTKITLGSAISIDATTLKEYRPVPAPKGSNVHILEHSPDGSVDMAARFSCNTSRLGNGNQESLTRTTQPIIRSIDDTQTRVAANVIETKFVFNRQASRAEKEEALNSHIRGILSDFGKAFLLDGEAIN